MPTAVISGRVDMNVRDRANPYIRAAGYTAAGVISAVWEYIARTGQMPWEHAAEQASGQSEEPDDLQAFFNFCDSLDFGKPEDDWLHDLTDEQMHDMIAQGKMEQYERL